VNLLLVNPGASYATMDVSTGYRDALRRQGHTVREYRLDERLDDAGLAYTAILRRKGLGKPSPALIMTKACADIIPQALYHNVDGVLIVSGMYCHPDYLVLLRRAGIPTAIILTESPYDLEQETRIVPFVDVAFTNERTSVPALRQANPNTHYLPHCYDPAKHRPGFQPGDQFAAGHDVTFVGTLFRERIDLLGAVDWEGIDLGIYGARNLLPSRHRLRKYIRGGLVDNDRAAALYRRAKIGLNLYRTSKGFGWDVAHIDHAESLSPRAVELAACGVFHLSEDRAEVGETFGDDVPVFQTAAQLAELVRFYLQHPPARYRIERALPAYVEHLTFDRQAAFVVSTLRAAWSGAGAAIGA
jgi:spore maturation protein CgeB